MTIRALSIRSRVALWYATSILLVLLAAGLLLRVAVRRTLLAEFDDDAVDSSTLVRHFFHVEASEYPTAEQAVTDLVAEVVFPQRAIHFIRPNGTLLTPSPQPAASRIRAPVRTLVVPLDSERAPGWQIRIVSSAADLEHTLRDVDGWFLFGLPCITLLAGVLGWTLAGRLLGPVDDMARAAERIGATESSARLPVRNPHDELGRLGGSFNALLERLDAALAHQRRFLADAAHELRTPIARMAGLTELTLRSAASAPGTAASPPAEEALALIGHDLAHASRLLDELLQLARADAGERMQRRERIFLDDVVMDALRSWGPAAQHAGIALTVGPVSEAAIDVDPLLAKRLADILFENAVRYTPAGGRVEASVTTDGADATFTVTDSGIGVPADELPHVFDRFFRGAASRPLAPEGSGLGLPIAAWIVDQCGGTIELTPAPGGGTCARVRLPVSMA